VKLQDKVAVVTGAAGGIGLAVATAFVEAGMRVVLADLDEPTLRAEVDRLAAAGAEVAGHVVDVTDAAAVEELAGVVVERFGALHVAVNNAGIVVTARSWELALEDWRRTIDVNLWGVIHGIRAFVPRILATGERGHVVNTGSMASVAPQANLAAYTATKHAVLGISDCLREELVVAGAPVGVTVVMPGMVRTRMNPSGIDASLIGAAVRSAVEDDAPYVFSDPDRMKGVRDRFDSILRAADRISYSPVAGED